MREEMFSAQRARPWTHHIAIVITDGESNYPDRTAREAALAHADKIEIIAIGVGVNINRNELRSIASDPSRVFLADSYAALDGLRELLAYTACHG